MSYCQGCVSSHIRIDELKRDRDALEREVAVLRELLEAEQAFLTSQRIVELEREVARLRGQFRDVLATFYEEFPNDSNQWYCARPSETLQIIREALAAGEGE